MENKLCTVCGTVRPISMFYKIKGTNRYRYMCNPCRRVVYKNNPDPAKKRATEFYAVHKKEIREHIKEKRANNLNWNIWRSAKARAKKKGIPFDISILDVIIPTVCPVLGIELCVNRNTAGTNSPSLDRIIPELGYVQGNIIVVSNLANTIKSNATPEQIRKVADFYDQAYALGVTYLDKMKGERK